MPPRRSKSKSRKSHAKPVMMSPSIWGPLVWRLLHGFAKIHDDRMVGDKDGSCSSWLAGFLRLLRVILPCQECRSSYAQFLLKSEKEMVKALGNGSMMEFVFALHNMVNEKLGRPSFGPFELVKRRSEVWDCEALESELLGLCIIVSLNYEANQEPEKEMAYRDMLTFIPGLARAMWPDSHLADAMLVEWTGPMTEQNLLLFYTRVFCLFYNVDNISPSQLAARYGLCRA